MEYNPQVRKRYDMELWYVVYRPLRCPGHCPDHRPYEPYDTVKYLWKTDLKFHESTESGHDTPVDLSQWPGYYASAEEAEKTLAKHLSEVGYGTS